MIKEEIESIISEIEKIENNLDDSIKNSDFEEFSKSLNKRYLLLQKLESYKTDLRVLEFVNNILKKDSIRQNLIEKQINELKDDQLQIQKSKKAMKNGYLRVDEEMRRHNINKSG
jgi:hypothetical protein